MNVSEERRISLRFETRDSSESSFGFGLFNRSRFDQYEEVRGAGELCPYRRLSPEQLCREYRQCLVSRHAEWLGSLSPATDGLFDDCHGGMSAG